MHPAPEWTSRVKENSAHHDRQAFRHAHSSLGAAGHWLREAGILAPLVISELVKSPEKQWKYIRIASITTALVSEAMWTAKVHHERAVAREREAACHEPA